MLSLLLFAKNFIKTFIQAYANIRGEELTVEEQTKDRSGARGCLGLLVTAWGGEHLHSIGFIAFWARPQVVAELVKRVQR